MSDDLFSDYTPDDWHEVLFSVGSSRDPFDLEGWARLIAREPSNVVAQAYFGALLDESASGDLELAAFFGFRDDERRRAPRNER